MIIKNGKHFFKLFVLNTFKSLGNFFSLFFELISLKINFLFIGFFFVYIFILLILGDFLLDIVFISITLETKHLGLFIFLIINLF